MLATDGIEIRELVRADKAPIAEPAALALVRQARRLVVAKGKQTVTIDVARDRPDDATLRALVIGPSGNLRAPTFKVGSTLLVGFNAEAYAAVFG